MIGVDARIRNDLPHYTWGNIPAVVAGKYDVSAGIVH
jgi:hypothetical protein